MEAGNPPLDTAWLQELQQAFFTQRCLHAIARLGIADLLVGGPLTAAEIAGQCDADPDALARVLRLLVSRGIFSEPAPGTYALNARAALFRSDAANTPRWHFMHDLPARAAAGILHSVRTGDPAFDKLHGRSLWAHLAEHPEENDWFNRHMRAQALALALPAVAAYDWTASRTVVDVGGGTGIFLNTVLEKNPQLNGILVDQPHVISSAQLGPRATAVAGDFFQAIPARGDTYTLSRVLHDWDDEHAVRILRTVRAAMSGDDRLLVLEMVVPEDGTPHPSKMLDIAMLVQFGGRERTAREYATLFSAGSLKLARTFRTAGPTTVLEAVPQ